jgi:hypothetical protein
MADMIVTRHVETSAGNTFDIPYVVKRLTDLDMDDVEFYLNIPKVIPGKPVAAGAAARPRVQLRCKASDGKKYRILLRMKTRAVRGIDSYPPTEEDETKQAHTVKISPLSEEEKDKMMELHDLIANGVFTNFKALFNKAAPKSVELVSEMCACPVKEGEDAEGNKYPPQIRLKVKPDVNQKPNIDIYQVKDGKVQMEPERMKTYADLKAAIPRGVDQVVTFEPSFYISGTNYGWTLVADSMLFPEKQVTRIATKPMYGDEDAEMLQASVPVETEKAENTEDEFTPESEEETPESVPVVETVDSDEEEVVEEEEEEPELPPPPKARTATRGRKPAAK